MQRIGEDRGEGQERRPDPAALLHHPLQRLGGAGPRRHGRQVQPPHPLGQGMRDADGAAIQVQGDGGDHRRALAAGAQARRQGHRPQHVGAVEQPRLDLVADGRPGGLAHQGDRQPFRLEQTEGVRHRQGRAVDQRDEAKAQGPADHGALPFSNSA